MTKIYRFADVAVELTAVNPAVHAFCSAYTDAGPVDFSVAITQADIDFEREKSVREDALEGIPVRQFSDAYLETR